MQNDEGKKEREKDRRMGRDGHFFLLLATVSFFTL